MRPFASRASTKALFLSDHLLLFLRKEKYLRTRGDGSSVFPPKAAGRSFCFLSSLCFLAALSRYCLVHAFPGLVLRRDRISLRRRDSCHALGISEAAAENSNAYRTIENSEP